MKLKSTDGYHVLKCDCEPCATRRVAERVALWQQHGAVATIDPDKTVFVRSFWRAQANHMTKMPNSRRALIERLRILAKYTRGAK